jgi:predicted metal-dependent HD superfamily phosphohydrolase
MFPPERLDRLQAGFARLLAAFGVAPAAAYPVFDRLANAWAEPHRHYHTLWHLDEVLRVVGKLRDYCEGPAAVELAAWFHDAVYDTHAKDNEEQSALLAERELATLGVPANITRHVAHLVRATTHTDADVDRDAAVLLDADLAVFGAAEDRYRQYAEQIRLEYSWVPHADYRTGRARVLESFLKRNRIYRTERMHVAGDEAARRNLTAEIAALTG